MRDDAQFFLEGFTAVKGFSGLILPFMFNHPQLDYYRRIWCGDLRRDIMVKSRKWGFTTLRVGLGLHGAMYCEGRVFRIVSQRAETGYEINKTVKLLYDSAHRNLTKRGFDPDYYLPRRKYDNRREYFFPDTQSAVIVDTARGSGVGQSDRSDDLYITEYSDWDNAEDKRAALVGSVPVGDRTRITIDFNAHGIGNDAYVQYQAAKRVGQEDWNGFHALFYGVPQCSDLYDADFLAERRKILGARFAEVYPANDEEVWLKADDAVFDWDDIRACQGKAFYCDAVPEKEYLQCEFYHGVDTATGKRDGDFQVMKSFALVGGALVEALPPVRTRVPEDVFAKMVHDRAVKYPGPVTVERNVGTAVLVKLKEYGTPNVVRFRDPVTKHNSQPGFQMTYPSKRMCISDLANMLRERSIVLVSPNGINELRTFEWKDNQSAAGAPELKDAHDDEAMATMLAIQGLKQKPGQARAGYRD